MSNLKKIGLILWKNWLFRNRHYVMTALEIIFPAIFAISIFLMRLAGGQVFEVVYHPNFTQSESFNLSPFSDSKFGNLNGKKNEKEIYYFLYYPNTSVALDLLKYIDNYTDINLKFDGVKNEKDIDVRVVNSKILEQKIYAAVVFDGLTDGKDLFIDKLKYKIRLQPFWFTGELEDAFDHGGYPTGSVYKDRTYFILFQHAIALRIIEKKSEKLNLLKKFEIETQPLVYPPYYDNTSFTTLLKILLPLFITLSYLFTAPITVRRIVREKESGIKELMKLMGISTWVQWFGWFFTSFIIMAISAIIIVSFLCAKHGGVAVLDRSAFELVYVIFLFYIASAICFCFFISTLFNKPTVAAGVTILVWLLSFTVPYYSLFEKYRRLRASHKLLYALLPNMAMGWALKLIAAFEAQGDGIQWSNINEPTRGDNISLLEIIGMMMVDVLLYSLLTWYIDNVRPGAFGVPRPYYFLFTASYWKRQKAAKAEITAEISNNRDKFEEEPTGLSPSVAIRNLSKAYRTHTDVLAVNNLNLNIYEGQITALLGHNGAGKTTTMSILTGMFPPTKGTAYVNGHDIRTEIDEARKDLGLCPQQNILFDGLTVKEHLEFFGKLKMDSSQDLSTEVTELMKKLRIFSRKDTYAVNLSGGMKRKLHLGIALIGGPKVVMLDEPTSGMDPEARRLIWDLLQEYRTSRCILLSTHFMEEADILGDRIAIMARGQIECCGSSLFLKKQYGAGYNLTLCLDSGSRVNEITNIIQSHVKNSNLKASNEFELCYNLPSDDAHLFPRLFETLETNSDSLKIKSFGLSVTTMEEVFLKVGELVETENNVATTPHSTDIILQTENDVKVLQKNTGLTLKAQQFYGLLLKRFYYTRHRYALLAVQILVPVLIAMLFVSNNNQLVQTELHGEPSRLLDLSPYKHCITFLDYKPRSNTELTNLTNYYSSNFPSNCIIRDEIDPIEYMQTTGFNDYIVFRDKLLFGSAFYSHQNGGYKIEIWHNEFFLHILPTALNLVHNAILKFNVKNENISLQLENEPLKVIDDFEFHKDVEKVGRSVLIGVFIPIGLCTLVASFIVFPIHERVTKCKHIQFMTGIGGILFWISSFLWDFCICFISCIIMVIYIAVFDKTNIFNIECSGVLFFLLLLYCWASIPFTYLASFLCKLPASGFTAVSVINSTIGLIFGIWVFVEEIKGYLPSWKWICSLVPNYTGTVALMKIVYVGVSNSFCKNINRNVLESACQDLTSFSKIHQCCSPEICGEFCLKKTPYFNWEWPGLGPEFLGLALDGFIYFILIFFIESSTCYKLCQSINQLVIQYKLKRKYNIISSAGDLDSDVDAEKERIQNLPMQTAGIRSDYLVVHDLTKYFSNFTAVDGLNFGVENGTCFGLLGINGAGKTTTFRQLTGDLLIDSGDAFIQDLSIKKNKLQYLANVGYCPQFDSLIDYMTGREILNVFTNLYGIVKSQIGSAVEKSIVDFDLTKHADKLVLAYSGGNKRKLSTALAFVGQPAVVFLDEPTTGVDPMARRKIWNMIKESNSTGTAIVLTSHSMEECEVLCSRIGIMVNGQFQCVGGIQYLKNKFSQGYTIQAKLKLDNSVQDNENNQNKLKTFIEKEFPTAILKDVHQGLVDYQIRDPNVKLMKLFDAMEAAKESLNLEDYSVSQATLEQVFLSFARKQRVVSEN